MDFEKYIVKNVSWNKLPSDVQTIIGNADEYSKKIKEYSIVNQLKYKDNLIKTVEKNQRAYYDQLLRYSREHYMLFPYHLSNYIINGMRVTPFQYYQAILIQMIEQEKNYDTLPNFTAADCVRLMGIGRNQYIDLMNQYKSSKKFLGMIRRPIKDLLPSKPVEKLFIDFWWTVRPGYITEDDIKSMVTPTEKVLIDIIINENSKSFIAGHFPYNDVSNLYIKGLIYFDIIIEDDDLIYIPPLEGFVMNRLTGDYFETLLYKIFVSIDEKTFISELSEVLQIDLNLVKNAISMYCRLGFAFKKNNDINVNNCHHSWLKHFSSSEVSDKSAFNLKENFINSLEMSEEEKQSHVSLNDVLENNSPNKKESESIDNATIVNNNHSPMINSSVNNFKRIGLFYDSTLAAFLMMGNLTPGLKSHAVTMFEVGKLSDESMDNFITELAKIKEFSLEDEAGGEAERYFLHAIILCQTVQFLRNNSDLTKELIDDNNDDSFSLKGLGLDLIRCESLLNLDEVSCERLLCRNYELLISVAPLSNETQIFTIDTMPYFGASSLVNSIWFKLYLYSITNCGPPSLLISKGIRLSRLPSVFYSYNALMLTPWGRDSTVISISNSLIAINESTIYNPVLIQAYPLNTMKPLTESESIHLALPLLDENNENSELATSMSFFEKHSAVKNLSEHINLQRICGYLTFIKYRSINKNNEWMIFDCHFGIPLFDKELNKNVCNRIQLNQLFERAKLQDLIESNRKLFHDIGIFINSFVDITTINANKCKQNKVPLPTSCIFFNNGNIEKCIPF